MIQMLKRKVKADGKKWAFDIDLLQKGDVLFTRSDVAGSLIAKATGGPFGHAMLYLGKTIIHATPEGV